MIISASRRTDIPAFYSKWFMNRIREGYCYVPNPMNINQVSKISLSKEDVEGIIFWSKNPAPLLPYLDEIDSMGYSYYFQYTLNAYPRSLEPNIPTISKRIDTFKDLSKRIGSMRVVWRYDPIIISNYTDFNFHVEQFAQIANELKDSTNRVMISIIDYYKKTDRRLSQLEKEEGFQFEKDALSFKETRSLLRDIAEIANNNNMEIYSCAEEVDLEELGIPHGRCIDNTLINKIGLKDILYKKDPYQREACLCNLSKDIGMNNTCMHGCLYCYATQNNNIAKNRFAEHDPYLPSIWGKGIPISKKNIKEDLQLKLGDDFNA